MATETIIPGDVTVDGKVSFTAEGQARIEEIVKESQGRAGNEARARAATAETKAAELSAQVTEMSKQLKELKSNSSNSSGEKTEIEQLRAKLDEVKSIQDAGKTELERKNQELAAKDKEAREARADAVNVRTKVAIQTAASESGFFNLAQVTKLTAEFVKYDEATKAFVVFNENGTERLNSEYKPMSLKEFYIQFAAENPYLVRGDVKGGSGSSESARTGLSKNGKYTVDQIFGKGSNAGLAQALAKSNIAEYHRLKAVARESGLIA